MCSQVSIDPRSTPHPTHRSHLFSTLCYQDQMGPTVSPCIASPFLKRAPPPTSQPPFSSLSPDGFARLWHPTDFVTLRFLARGEKYQAESPFHQAKDGDLTKQKHEEEALATQMGLTSMHFECLVCFCLLLFLLLLVCQFVIRFVL